MNLPDAPTAHQGFFVAHFFSVKDRKKSMDFMSAWWERDQSRKSADSTRPFQKLFRYLRPGGIGSQNTS